MALAALAYPAKSAEAFRTISEVADELDVPQHVLRFWESRFAQIRPVKRAGGRRYYRPDDVDLLKGIRALLYSDGFTIKGVQKVLKERGLRHVAQVGRSGVTMVKAPEPVVIEKIVYVEKPVAQPVKKARPAHLRAVPDAMSLPFFDEPVRDFPVLDAAPVDHEVAVSQDAPMDARLAADELARLETLLGELTGLKARLRAARERTN
ncbi:MAG TPA: MerR family transcriptional regulator [Rhizomicrobium sp.]